MSEQARLVKTVKVHMPIAKWDMDQTVGSPRRKLWEAPHARRGGDIEADVGVAIDWVTSRSPKHEAAGSACARWLNVQSGPCEPIILDHDPEGNGGSRGR